MPLNLPPPKASTSAAVNEAARKSPSSLDTVPTLPPTSSSAVAPKSSLSLPPPKTKAKLAAGSQPKKFVLDLPKPGRSLANAALEGEPAKKKARTEGGGEGFGIDGLLPEPKRTAGLGALLPAPKAASLPANDGKAGEVKEKAAVSLIPHTLKGKGKALPKKVADESDTAHVGAEKPAAVDSDADFFGLTSVPTHEPAIDFFGLGGSSASTVKLSTSISTSKPSISAAPSTSTTVKNKISISSAPSTSAPSIASNYYATLPLPTPSDPYPGFYQLPSGQWAAKRPDEWEIWAKAQGWGQQDQPTQAEVPPEEPELPKDFEQVGIDRSVEVNAVKLRGQGGDTNARPSKIPEEDRIKAEEEAARAKASQKKITYVARSRHQLSTLIADARDNRAELEDRIAAMKNNKRSGGAKYGF